MLTRLLGLVLLFVVVAAWWTSVRSPKPYQQPYRWLKQRIGGRLRKRWFGLSQVLEVEYGDRRVVIDIKRAVGKYLTRVEVNWPEVDVEYFELTANDHTPQSGSSEKINLPGIGMPRCHVSSLTSAERLFSQSAWTELSRLISLATTTQLHILLRNKTWRLTGCIDEPSPNVVGPWVLQALIVYDQMRVHRQCEIAFGMNDTETVQEKCSVCQQTLDSALVQCPRCHSLHHRDCWEFIGHCSRFGCQETTWVAVNNIHPFED